MELTAEPKAVIYEVNLTIDVDVVERFDEWLHKHTEEMLAIPGFISASISVPDVEDEHQKHRCVQYRLSDQATLDNYLEHHAKGMRAKSLQHFEGHFTAKRRVLSVAEAALAKHGVCANCDAELLGRFCSVCGQREEPRVPTIGSVTSEFTNEVFGVESKLWRSFRLLLFKPGLLTTVYLSGKRQKYMSPLRLYLLFSIITFACFTLINSYGNLGVDLKTADDVEAVEEVGSNVKSATDNNGFSSDWFSEEANVQIKEEIDSSLSSIRRDIRAGNKQAVLGKFFKPLPKALFLFLPIVALLFKLLYLGSGRYYVEHLIYVLHNHAFLFAAIVFTTAVSQTIQLWPHVEVFITLSLFLIFSIYAYRGLREFVISKFSDSPIKGGLYLSSIVAVLALLLNMTLAEGVGVLIVVLWLVYVPYYIYRSMRVVYERSRWVTMASLMLIAMIYLFLLTVMISASIVFVGYTYN
jgi:hypothetical protein